MNKLLQREEAIQRLQWMRDQGVKWALPTFKGGDVGIFENQNPVFDATFYKLKLNTGDDGMYDQLDKICQQLEAEGNVVYLIQISHTGAGRLASFFFVSSEQELWNADWEDFKYNEQFCYVANLDDDIYSEYGTIGFKVSPQMGGLVRIA